MLRSLEIQARNFSVRRRPQRRKNIRRNHLRRMERYMGDRQHAWRLRRNHPLAAIVTLVRRVTRHRAAALLALLVLGRGRHAVREL